MSTKNRMLQGPSQFVFGVEQNQLNVVRTNSNVIQTPIMIRLRNLSIVETSDHLCRNDKKMSENMEYLIITEVAPLLQLFRDGPIPSPRFDV